jgi:hypothetical protein
VGAKVPNWTGHRPEPGPVQQSVMHVAGLTTVHESAPNPWHAVHVNKGCDTLQEKDALLR